MAVGMGSNGLPGMRILLVAILVGGLPAVVTAVEFVDLYKSGLAAMESRNWTLAADRLRQAIEQQPTAKAKVKKAFYFKRYVPHFYLGKALLETGDCPGALTAWLESERQGVIRRYPEYQEILDGRTACEEMVGLEAALAEVLRAVEQAEGAGIESRRRLGTLPSSLSTTQSLLDRQSQAEASLGRVRRRLASADTLLEEVEEAATLAEVAAREFEAIGAEAEALRVARMTVRREELAAQIQSQMGEARQVLRASEYLQPYPPMVARGREAVERALKKAQARSAEATKLGELQSVQQEMTQAVEALRKWISPPPIDLQDAAAAYLRQEYSRVLEILADRRFASPRATTHSHLLQAAALYALYYSTGAADESLLERARDEVLACRGSGRDPLPTATVFSPGFVAFFADQSPELEESNDENNVGKGR